MKKLTKVFLSLVTTSLLGGTVVYADAIEHTLEGNIGYSTYYYSTVSDASYEVDYSYNHREKIYQYSSERIKFENVRFSSGNSSPNGAQYFVYTVVDVEGGGANTETFVDLLGLDLEGTSETFTTGVTLYSTSSESAYTEMKVCADRDGCNGSQANVIYDRWIYVP